MPAPGEILGDIKLTAAGQVQSGYLGCQGQTIALDQYQALFSLTSAELHKDGRSKFVLPDLGEA